tara:strand:+ start:492 stop:809 length:318 start_codon:yes stop_codon:yes gene_type:complete
LLAPVTKVVDGDDVVSKSLVNVLQEVTNNSGAQVTSVKWLRDVGRAILHHHGLPFTKVRVPEGILLFKDFLEYFADNVALFSRSGLVRYESVSEKHKLIRYYSQC